MDETLIKPVNLIAEWLAWDLSKPFGTYYKLKYPCDDIANHFYNKAIKKWKAREPKIDEKIQAQPTT